MWYAREVGRASPAAKAAGPIALALGLAPVETVLLVKPALVTQSSAARIEIALLGIETTLLVPIGSVALVLAPTVLRRWRRPLAGHSSADALQDITRILRTRRRRRQQECKRTNR
jgi:hypothetical protein